MIRYSKIWTQSNYSILWFFCFIVFKCSRCQTEKKLNTLRFFNQRPKINCIFHYKRILSLWWSFVPLDHEIAMQSLRLFFMKIECQFIVTLECMKLRSRFRVKIINCIFKKVLKAIKFIFIAVFSIVENCFRS